MKFLSHRPLLILLVNFFLLNLLASSQAFAAELSSQVDRNQISINETINLRVIYDQQTESSALDLRSLATDFEIISNRPQSSSSISIINGKTETIANTTWDIVLVPKRQGKLTIPAFKLGSTTSQAINIDVTDSSTNGAASDAPLTALISTDNDVIYNNQQLLIEVELSASAAVRDLNGEQISIEGAEIEFLGQDGFQRNDNGVIRQVITLTYALFANEAGTIKIPALTFNGVEGGSRSLFDRRSRGKSVAARTEPIEITVKPSVEKPGTPWFTASNVIISSQWSRDKAQAKVGEPLTRTISIIANGQRASAIPPLENNSLATSYKAYADQPQLENQKSSTGYKGVRTESEAIVPSQSGTITLPEKRMNWWNTNSQRWEEAILPAETLEVAANSEVASNFNASSTAAEFQKAATQSNTRTESSVDVWKFATLFLAALTVIQFVMLFSLRNKKQVIQDVKINKPNESQSWQTLVSALQSEDASSMRKAIISWSNIVIDKHSISSLQALGETQDAAELKPLLEQLDQHLYNGGDEANLADLSSALTHALSEFKDKLTLKQKGTADSVNDLAPLYPQ